VRIFNKIAEKVARRVLRRHGHDIVRFDPAGSHSLGVHLQRVLRDLRIDCVIDIGAHQGLYGCLLRELGYAGRIVSFEPVPESYEVLHARCDADGLWSAHQLALGATNETRELNVLSGTELSSFLSARPQQAQWFGDRANLQRRVSVDVRRLDDVLPELMDRLEHPRIFLKIDAQRWELEILRGGVGTLERALATQCEIGFRPLYIGEPDWREILDFLTDRGYGLSGLYPVAREGLLIIDCDCVFVRPYGAKESL
jgi:FkbM family methyltransferase